MTHLLFVVTARPFVRGCRPLRCPRILDCHFCFFLVTAGAYVHWCRSQAPLHVLLLHLLPLHLSTGLQVAAEGWWAFVFFPNTSFPCNCPRKPFCGDKALKAHTPFGVCDARPGGLCAADSAALGSGLLQAPLFRFLACFSPSSHKKYGELLHSLLPCLQLCAILLTHRLFQRTSTFAAPLRGSVCACSGKLVSA